MQCQCDTMTIKHDVWYLDSIGVALVSKGVELECVGGTRRDVTTVPESLFLILPPFVLRCPNLRHLTKLDLIIEQCLPQPISTDYRQIPTTKKRHEH
jgi:hypothetical protein